MINYVIPARGIGVTREAFEYLETGFWGVGRRWILDTDKP